MAVNLLFGTSNSTSYALKQANTAELNNLSNYILERMASGAYTGTLTADTSPGGSYTTIGTFQDTQYVNPPGSGDLTITSTFYDVSQIQSATLSANPEPPEYLGLISNSTYTIARTNITTANDLADQILQSMIATSPYGINSFYLGETAPVDGGTWATVGTGVLVDDLNGTQINGNYYIWRKIDNGTTTSLTTRPLKLDDANSNRPKEFSNSELDNIIKKVEERIVATGIGLYTLASSPPGTGTWSAMGTVTDTISTTVPTTYIGETNYDGIAPDAAIYSGPTGYDGTAQYLGETNYTGTVPAQFAGFASFAGTAQYEGVANFEYAPGFNGPAFTRTSFGGAQYQGPNFGYFLGPAYDGPVYVGAASYTATFQPSYIGRQGFLTFTSPAYVGPTASYFPTYIGTFQGVAQFTGPAQYTSPAQFAGVTPVNYLGPQNFTGPATYGAVPYTGPAPASYLGDANYDGTGIASYASTAGAGGTLTLYRRVA